MMMKMMMRMVISVAADLRWLLAPQAPPRRGLHPAAVIGALFITIDTSKTTNHHVDFIVNSAVGRVSGLMGERRDTRLLTA